MESPEERAHWKAVLKAFDGYMQYHLSANHSRRMAFLQLPKEDKLMFEALGYREKLEAVDEGIRRNAEFIDEMIADPVFAEMMGSDGSNGHDHDHQHLAHGHSHSHDHDHGYHHDTNAHESGQDHHQHISLPANNEDEGRFDPESTTANPPHTTPSHSDLHPHSDSHPMSHPSPHSQSHITSSAGPLPMTRPKSQIQAEQDQAQDKVRSTLRSFVRDWAEEGKLERANCYDPCLEALERIFPAHTNNASQMDTDVDKRGATKRDRKDIRVLVPGCGLGRLAMEIAARGFASQGNEFSTYMLVGSYFVLNQTTHPKSHQIFPYLHSFSNHLTTSDHLLKSVLIPDVCPADVLGTTEEEARGEFSLVAGDFEEVYGSRHWGPVRSGQSQILSDIQDGGILGDDGGGMRIEDEEGEREGEGEGGNVNQRGRYGAVVTCFFIDTARNVLNYLKIIHTILEDDGVWINLGPLLWHFENSPPPKSGSSQGQGSIELSLDEVKQLAVMVGFEIRDERNIKTTYTGVPDGMLRHEYDAAFFTATKRKPQSPPSPKE